MSSQQACSGYQVRASTRTGFAVLTNIYVALLTAITASVVHLDLGGYFFVLTGGEFLPKYAYFALAVAIAPLFMTRNCALWVYLNTPFTLWALAFVSLNFVHWLVHLMDGNGDAAALTFTRIQFLVLAVLIGFLYYQARPALLGKTFVALALMLTALQLIDFFMPGTLLPVDTPGVVLGRASSTLINANKAVESLVLLAVVGMAILRPAWRVWLLLIVFPGVFLTFSRSGLLAWLIVVAAGFWFRLFSRSTYVLVLLAIPMVVGSAAGLLEFIFAQVDGAALDNVYHRVMFISSLDTNDYSALERQAVAGYAFESFLSHPLFGNGAGYTHFWGVSDQAPHNQHLMMLAEYGIAGYGLFLWLIVLMFRGGAYFRSLGSPALRMLAFAVFLLFTLFTHNMFDHLYWLMTFALLSQRKMRLT